MGQAIGITHALANTQFKTADGSGAISGVTASAKYIMLDLSDLGITEAQGGGSAFDVEYTDGSGSAVTYVGNLDLLIHTLVEAWNTKFQAIKTAYDTDQAKASANQNGTSAPPDAVSSNGFTNFSTSGGTGNKLKNSIILNFLYDEPTVALVDEDDD